MHVTQTVVPCEVVWAEVDIASVVSGSLVIVEFAPLLGISSNNNIKDIDNFSNSNNEAEQKYYVYFVNLLDLFRNYNSLFLDSSTDLRGNRYHRNNRFCIRHNQIPHRHPNQVCLHNLMQNEGVKSPIINTIVKYKYFRKHILLT